MKQIGIIFFFILGLLIKPVSAFSETVLLWGGEFSVEFNGSNFDGFDTTYSYTVCTLQAIPMQGFSHVVIGLPNCSPGPYVLSCDPNGCIVQTDPTTQVFGVKWNDSISAGHCKDYSFSIAGNHGVQQDTVVIKAGNCT